MKTILSRSDAYDLPRQEDVTPALSGDLEHIDPVLETDATEARADSEVGGEAAKIEAAGVRICGLGRETREKHLRT